jgi:hypothetical protein
MQCPLCLFKTARPLIPMYWHCPECDLRYLDSSRHLTPEEEHERYRLHNNDVHDENYRRFSEPLLQALVSKFPKPARGLDFGAGAGPIIAKQLIERGYEVSLYDPYFHPDKTPLTRTYDFIFASEVAEHFYEPGQEFGRLRMLLEPGGWLGIMTAIYEDKIDFNNWYYRRDPTHTVFYSRQTFRWIQSRLNFGSLEFYGDRVALLQK